MPLEYSSPTMVVFDALPRLSSARLDASLTEAPLDLSALRTDHKAQTVLYLAYGSNLCDETFRGVRGIRPLSQVNVLVPSLKLTFDLPGIPYQEPCFANTALRVAGAHGPGYDTEYDSQYDSQHDSQRDSGYHKDRWHKGLVGVVYAQPSPRYLKLITDGAAQRRLPAEYQHYLHHIRTYTITTSKQKIGKSLFLAIWMPFVTLVLALARKLQDKHGRAPSWLAQLSACVFVAMWMSYDTVFKPAFGDGERTIGDDAVQSIDGATTRQSPSEHHAEKRALLQDPSLLFTLAAKNNIPLPTADQDATYASPETLSERYSHFTNLDDFLQYYYRGIQVLVHQEDFEMLAWEYFMTAKRDGVHHAEVFFDPQSHTERGLSFDMVVEGFNTARARAEKELGITSQLIMCFLRHLPVQSAAETMALAVAGGHFDINEGSKERAITGLGLDSSEVGFRPELFVDQFREGRERGLRRTAHAGEEGDPSYISGALDTLHTERIDHGIRLIEDPKLLGRVVENKVLLTVCPLSNVCLQAVKHVSQLPIKTFLQAGVMFSINSDDPAYFGGYILSNYCAVQEAFDLSMDDWKTVARNSIHGSWLAEGRKTELLATLDSCMNKHAGHSSVST
ncbi:adenine deaminase [Pyrenophora seminiperda CCB06]|uniref:Adenine deaminase n=1 Tax=Pyrenophora seminiperda CCB06 TaxID=1302712 RepID=A0A3M7ME08_9PLEO|nr:adenine deaminase [Pyrenophora seminiperda CCB06]